VIQDARTQRILALGLLAAAALVIAGCAGAIRPPEMTPFTRGVLLIYDGTAHQCARKSLAEALLYLELEPSVPRTVTVRAFTDKDQPMALDPRSIKWSADANVKVEPEKGSATVRVTPLNGDNHELVVEAAGHAGQLKIRKKR
jgi:hypothetical protein